MGSITAVPIDIGENNENVEKIFRILKSLSNPFYLAHEETFNVLLKYKKNYEEEMKLLENRHIFMKKLLVTLLLKRSI